MSVVSESVAVPGIGAMPVPAVPVPPVETSGPVTLSVAETYVLYHRDADGFASAFAAWCALGDANVHYISVQYGEPLPEIAPGSRVFIVDFSYRREVLEALHTICPALVVLDHHKSAAEELAGLDYCVFDMSRAGCEIAWGYFSDFEGFALPGTIPWILRAVADRDLWQFKLPHTREICARLDLEKWDFELWHNIAVQQERGVYWQRFLDDGRVVLRVYESQVKMQCKRAWTAKIAGHHVPVVNVSLLTSETCHELLEQHPSAPFVAVYNDDMNSKRVSLRGRGDFDVSLVAKMFGGGGHHNAAGFARTHTTAPFVSWAEGSAK